LQVFSFRNSTLSTLPVHVLVEPAKLLYALAIIFIQPQKYL